MTSGTAASGLLRVASLIAGALLVTADAGARMAAGAVAMETVQVTVPAALLFDVSNLSAASVTSAPATLSFRAASLEPSHTLRVSVKADDDLTVGSGATIPADALSWTSSNVLNGIGMNGALSKTTYATVFEGQPGATEGRVDLTWKLHPPPGVTRAGAYQMSLRWRLESVAP